MRWLLMISALIQLGVVTGQNLIPNPEFNQCDQCGTIGRVQLRVGNGVYHNNPPDWRAPTYTSSDILNIFPRSKHFSGGFIPGPYHEYLANEFIEPLEPLAVYHFSFYISSRASTYTVDKIGVHIVDSLLDYPTWEPLDDISPTFQTQAGLIFNSNYNLVEFEYVACGGEEGFILGRFDSLEWEEIVVAPELTGPSKDTIMYFFVDDFEMVKMDVLPANLPDTLVYCKDTILPITFESSKYDWTWQGVYQSQLVIDGPGTYILERSCPGHAIKRMDTVEVIEREDFTFPFISDTIVCYNEGLEIDLPELPEGRYYLNGHVIEDVRVQDSGVYIFEIETACESIVDSFHVSFPTTEECDRLLCPFFVPNSITPNGDNINDCLDIFTDNQVGKWQIFTRWGELIYSGNETWCGQDDKGQLLMPGVYVYLFKMLCLENRERTVVGEITLIR